MQPLTRAIDAPAAEVVPHPSSFLLIRFVALRKVTRPGIDWEIHRQVP
jgi:hypothetical protein